MELAESIYSVGQLTQLIKELFWQTEALREVAVRGELSNLKRHTSGHYYFTLKDDNSALRAVMFRQDARTLRFQPENGMQVLVFGRVGIYERGGIYQIYAQRMEPHGMGSLHLALERAKAALEEEGWFDPSRKRSLPRLPRGVGIVTALGSASLSDIIKVGCRRYPALRLVIADVRVQGDQAPDSIVRGLKAINRVPGLDVIILGRGGGSSEELWAFNHEQVVKAIGSSPLPVVSAIGHQSDVTLADLAADVRAATPSHAAELVVPQRSELEFMLDQHHVRLRRAMERHLQLATQRWRYAEERPVLQRPLEAIHQQRQLHDDLRYHLEQNFERTLQEKQNRVGNLFGRLEALNPLAVLARGFSVCHDEDGQVVKRARAVPEESRVTVHFIDGHLQCRVEMRRVGNEPEIPPHPGGEHDEG